MNQNPFNSLEEAVLNFYQSPDHATRTRAQEWLTQLTNSPRIWTAIWEELLPSKHTEVQFYGSTILHSKLLKDWQEIPADQYEALKAKLLEAVVYFKDGSKLVLNRLCISLAVLILRLTYLTWPNAVSELISLFQNASLFQNVPNVSVETLSCLLLEILSVIPEEFQTLILSKNEKILVRSALQADSVTVLTFLEVALDSSYGHIQMQAVKCSKSWAEFGFPPESCDHLLNALFKTVSLSYTDASSTCAVNAIEAISTICTHPNLDKYPKTIVSYLDKVLIMADIFNSSQDIQNQDFIPCLYTLYVTIGENHLKTFLKSFSISEREPFVKLLNIILQCTGAPGSYPRDEIHSIQTFTFWYQLQDELSSGDLPQREELIQLIKPVYKKLILVLMEKSMQPKDFQDWSLDDKEAFGRYRQDIADTYMYSYGILSHEFVDIIIHNIEVVLAGGNIVAEWRKIDSYLYALSAIAENASFPESAKILRCILLMQKLPLTNMHVQVSQTVMELLGSYAEWLCNYPELLDPILTLVFNSIENAQLAGPATLALKDIVRECKTILQPYAAQIAELTTVLLKKRHLQSSEEMRLVFSLSTVMSLLPEEVILKYLENIATPYMKKLQGFMIETNCEKKTRENEIIDCMGIFMQLFLGLTVHPPAPQFCLLKELLPILKMILYQYPDPKVINATCVAIKCAVSNLGDVCYELLPLIVDIVTNTLANAEENMLFELAKQLLILFGNNAMCHEIMSGMLVKICYITLFRIGVPTVEKVSEHTSSLEHFYSFCTNVLKKNLKLLLNTRGIDLETMFLCAGYALCAQEVQTVKSASSFLCNIIVVSREQDVLRDMVQKQGFHLVERILIAIGEISPRNCLEHVADVLAALSKKYCDYLRMWMNEILMREGFPTPRATVAAKKRFIQKVLRDKANKRKLQDTAKEFSFLCRGLLYKDYVEQAAPAL